MTDNEIIKALECCSKYEKAEDCILCPLKSECDCNVIERYALNLINRQKTELAELKSENKILKDSNINLQGLYEAEKERVAKAKEKCIGIAKALKTAKAEAAKEFAEMLKKISYYPQLSNYKIVTVADIDNLLKETVGENNG